MVTESGDSPSASSAASAAAATTASPVNETFVSSDQYCCE
jgi:hypothetical protein